LGGLSAVDLVGQHPYAFCRVGVFSGSFWWRKKAYDDGYDDENDRMMHVTIRRNSLKKGLKFWLQVGTNDETDDRNNNGVIDAIDDTLDIIYELKRKALENSIPYQNLIQMLIHQFATDKIKLKV
jgi:predicted alpha/beta superfamily hydrolase